MYIAHKLCTGINMDRFCIITNRLKDETLSTTEWIVDYLKSCSKQIITTDILENMEAFEYTDAAKIPDDTECAIVLGGDGTILQAAHDLRMKQIPILGINLGTLGFLAETEIHNLKQAFDYLFQDQYDIESRMMLSVTVNKTDTEIEKQIDSLNDVVITRSGFSRLISVGIYVNGKFVNEYRGDGVIISTPTGSTGYSLSAGGPIITPEAELMVITPICPHSLSARSIIVSSDDIIRVKICQSKKTQEEEAIATVDGNALVRLRAEDEIMIKKARHKTRLIRLEGRNFYDILRTKFGSNSI